MGRLTHLVGVVLIVLLAGSLLTGAVQGTETGVSEVDSPAVSTYADYDDGDEYEDEEEEEDEEGAGILGDWWGLGGEAQGAPYVGIVELSVVAGVVGVGGYSLGKRTGIVPLQHRRRLLQAHEWVLLAGAALAVPHFVAVEEWEGLGLFLGVLIAVELASGLYGRYLHRHVLRLGRGDEVPPLLGRVLTVTKRSVLTRWRTAHVLLTIATAIVLLLHIVTAVGD
jgi:hypothetical protein